MQPIRPPPPQPLPDVVPRFNCCKQQQQQHEVKQQHIVPVAPILPADRLSTPPLHQDEEDFSKRSNTLAWKQVGRDLQLIADAFSSSRCHQTQQHRRSRMITSTSADWIWNALLQSAVVYVAWKIHRWTSS
jgi:hypothetical protein